MTEEKVPEVVEGNGAEKAEAEITEEEIDLEKAIIRQVEYYFGDLNLPRDRYLREQVKLDEGWVPFDILLKFNRLARISTDTEVIVKALKKSTTGLLEISDDRKKVRRCPDLPLPEMNEEHRKELMSRTVYAKGFAKDAVLDDILKYFKQFEVVENVIMRRYLEPKTKKRLFKGSVFATFKTKEQAEKFIELKDLKCGESVLITKWQETYNTEKQEEYAAKKEKRDKKAKKEEEAAAKNDFKLPSGTVLHFSQPEASDKLKRENIKESLEKLDGEVAYIEFNSGALEGWVRLVKENSAKELFEKIPDGKLTIEDIEVTFKLLGDEEEKVYLAKTVEEIGKRRQNMRNNKYNNRRNFKGKSHHGRKRKQDQNDDAPSSKVKAN